MIGTMMLRAGLLSADQIYAARDHSSQHGTSLVEAVLALEFLDEDALSTFFHNKMMIPKVHADVLDHIDRTTLEKIPADLARTHRVVPVSADDAGNLTVAMVDPTDMRAVDAVANHTGAYLVRAVAPWSALHRALDVHYPANGARPPPPPQAAVPATAARGWNPAALSRNDEAPASRPPPPPVPSAQPPPPPDRSWVAPPVRSSPPPPPPPPPGASQSGSSMAVTRPPAPPAAAPSGTSVAAAQPPPPPAPPATDTTSPGNRPASAPSPSAQAMPRSNPARTPVAASPPSPSRAPSSSRSAPASASTPDRPTRPRKTAKQLPRDWNPPLPTGEGGPEPLSAEAFGKVIPRLVQALDRDEITRILLDFLGDGFERVILFTHLNGELRGRDARGTDLLVEAVRQVRMPAKGRSVFADVIRTKAPYFGPLVTNSAVNRAFAEALGGVSGNVLVLPVVLSARVPVLVFATGTTRPVDPRSIRALTDGVSHALERLIMRQKQMG